MDQVMGKAAKMVNSKIEVMIDNQEKNCNLMEQNVRLRLDEMKEDIKQLSAKHELLQRHVFDKLYHKFNPVVSEEFGKYMDGGNVKTGGIRSSLQSTMVFDLAQNCSKLSSTQKESGAAP